MKKITIACTSLVAASVLAAPEGYYKFGTTEVTGEDWYMSKPIVQKYRDGRPDKIFEYSTWSRSTGFRNVLANCKTSGLVYDTSIDRDGDKITGRPTRYVPGQLGYLHWEVACGSSDK